jgi:serine phosphatase RsbU (regulator of sigma subunit)
MEGALVSMSVMSMLKRSFMSECLDDPLEIVYKLYNEIGLLVEGDSTLGLDTEMAFLIYDKANQSASFIGTGLNLIHRTHDNVILHKSRFVHLQNKKIEVEEIDLNYGDQITMYTDGITDLFDKAGDKKLGTRGLMNFMQSEEDSSQSQVEKFLADFRGETSPLDDQTMLILTI